jgi:transposase-like protein
VYRAVDQYGQVIDVLVSPRRDAAAARRFFRRALATLKVAPSEVVTDAAQVYPAPASRRCLRPILGRRRWWRRPLPYFWARQRLGGRCDTPVTVTRWPPESI